MAVSRTRKVSGVQKRLGPVSYYMKMAAERLVNEHPDNVIQTDAGLFALLYPELRRFAAVVGPIEGDPDDLVQDALERTLRNHTLTELDNPRAYLFRTVLNLASNQKRSLARARKASARLNTEETTHQTYPSDLDELLRLPAQQRAVLFLREVEGLSHAEIAAQLGMTEQAAAKASQRARKRLSEELREEMK